MPQLLPDPWFMIMICAWATLLIIIPTKILTHTYPNQPTTEDTKSPSSHPLTMPWP